MACYLSVPKEIREITNNSKHLCRGSANYLSFLYLTCGLFFGLSSLCEIARTFPDSPSVSQLSRAAAALPAQLLLALLRKRVVKYVTGFENFEKRFILVLDDTLTRKHGSHPDVCYWFDHTHSKRTPGTNYLVITVYDTYTSRTFPVFIELLFGQKHPKYRKRIEVVKEALLLLKEIGLGSLTLTADSWFASSEFFEWLDKNGFTFEIEIRSNRNVTHLDDKYLGSAGEKGKDVYPNVSKVAKTLEQIATCSGGKPKRVAGGIVRLSGCRIPLKICAVWNQHSSADDGPFAYYATNKLDTSLSEIWTLSRHRWSIEVCFRTNKQVLSFDALPLHDVNAASNLTALSLFLYGNLELTRPLEDAELKPRPRKEQRTIYKSLSKYIHETKQRHENFNLLRILNSKKLSEKVNNHFSARGDPKRACQKPRDKEKEKVSDKIAA